MRENEFERKVQEQLEDLRIRPSDETWAKLEKELREKKKRRVAVLFFLLAGLLLVGYSGYTFFYKNSTQPVARNEAARKNTSIENTETPDNNNNNSAVAKKPVLTPQTKQPNEKQPNENGPVIPTLKNEHGKENSVATELTAPERTNQPGIINPGKKQKSAIVKNQAAKDPSFEFVPSSTAKKTIDGKQNKNGIVRQDVNDPVITDKDEKAIAGNPVDQTDKHQIQEPADKNVIVNSNSVAAKNVNSDNKDRLPASDSVAAIDSAVAKTDIKKTDLPLTEEPKPEIAKTKNNKKLKIGIEFSSGFVSSRDELFPIDFLGSRQKSLDVGPPQASGGINNPGGAGGPVIIPPSDIKSGNGWKLGLTAEKAISKRSSISAGIRYAYYDESLEVGSVRDTVIMSNSYSFSQNFLAASGIRGAYSTTVQQTTRTKYTNRYHFLELPVNFQTRLNRGKKMELLWNAGIAPGYMLSTNAVIYDSAAGGIYYKNKEAFKRFHFNVQTGLAFQFGNNKKVQWSVGPTVSLDMTRLMKEDVFTAKRYFLYTGLTGKLFLFRRK